MKILKYTFLSLFIASTSLAQSTARIINGSGVTKRVPYMAAIYGNEVNHNSFFCGGTLIAPGWVLTAAHCVKFMDLEKQTFYVGVGGIEIDKPKKISTVKSIYTDGWDANTMSKDWALLKLTKRLTSARYPALAVGNPPKQARIYGWGTIDPMTSVMPKNLQTLVIPVWNTRRCNKVLDDKFYRDSMICGSTLASSFDSNDGGDSCYGDSGGPLLSVGGGILYGITSWGIGCADIEYPGVYSNVASARKWILETIK